MKKLTVILALLATVGGSAAFADQNDKNNWSYSGKRNKKECKTEFAWGIGLCSLAVIAVVTGLTASCAAGNSNN